MQLSISNIAWDTSQDEAIADLLVREGVYCIDIAPGKYFSNLLTTSKEEISQVRNFWESRGIKIVGMQSLFFGTRGLNLFDRTSQHKMLRHLSAVRDIAVGLGIERITFGSPKNRDRSGLTTDEANTVAQSFFQQWSEINNNLPSPRLLIEPNPTIYGANFLTTTLEAIDFIREVNQPCIGLQLDLGTMTVNGESPEIIDHAAPFIGHVHISEPRLVQVGSTNAPHELYARKLQELAPSYLTIEMVVQESEKQISAVLNAIEFVRRVYGESTS